VHGVVRGHPNDYVLKVTAKCKCKKSPTRKRKCTAETIPEKRNEVKSERTREKVQKKKYT
jgi:hypothetical protein